jgi:CheY-like chemotaxis protein
MATSQPARPRATVPDPPGRINCRLVIVEGDPDTRQILRALAETRGIEVVGETDDGVAAIPLVARTGADVVVMAEVLPRLDGRDTAAILKEIAPRCRIIALTGTVRREAPWAHAVISASRLEKLPDRIAAVMRTVRLEEDVEYVRMQTVASRAAVTTLVQEWSSVTDERRKRYLERLLAQMTATEVDLDTLIGHVRAAVSDQLDEGTTQQGLPERVRLTGAASNDSEDGYAASVSIQAGEQVFLGESLAPDGLISVVAATLGALKKIVGLPTRFVNVETVTVGHDAIAIVVLEVGTTRLSGSAPVRGRMEDAVARATLDALNRLLESRSARNEIQA